MKPPPLLLNVAAPAVAELRKRVKPAKALMVLPLLVNVALPAVEVFRNCVMPPEASKAVPPLLTKWAEPPMSC